MEHSTATASQTNHHQKPTDSGFDAFSTAQDVIRGIDLTGKTIIVTGGYAGIGLETVKTFAQAGARVIVPARDVPKAARNLAGIPNTTVESLDLTSPASIDSFAARFLESGQPLDILVNNAGIMWVPLLRDARGYESQLSTNHLGHFQLTARLWPALKLSGNARVISVSSFGHHIAPFDFDDPNFEQREYETLAGYGQSKTANNLFAVALDHLGQSHGVRAFSLHPGSVNGTELGRVAPMELFRQMGTHDADGNIYPEVARKLKTIPQGAATTIWCATSPKLEGLGGLYCENADVAEVDHGNIAHRYDEPLTLRGVKPYSIDPGNARRLWTLSEQLTGIDFKPN
ncbi:SDR family NAD(P)-dependent oxidoreductase [Dyadobacter fermentans]|uniref:Short-chain dehydrogenase/reductase SDR n=1 Tax=Dyadobacter fermentans (strain ATCC 700827 / DSM 18053 / CIP 107007 / KCTC 52180 / NS114) TaxID=471854 RepID=C6VRQ6_DYAFD|nr:SDR family NAD(P)-dependent oxidoreductase [Dyadobacter fermentans]ACT92759.1 short-chain dehydrogenase/reductase SDR [Dyadobacter fermentans DSM 18053]